MRTLLGIDTSSRYTSVALWREGVWLDEFRSVAADSHTESLALRVSQCLERTGLCPAELSALVIGQGPGSFTGLRIGFAFVKGLALSLRVPIFPVSSFAALAQGYADRSGVLIVVRDARRDEFFFEVYRSSGTGKIALLQGPHIASSGELERLRGEAPDRWQTPREAVYFVKDEGQETPFAEALPSAHEARGLLNFWLARETAISGMDLSAVIGLEPVYVRAVAAKTIAERAFIPG